jgi:citrate synthase
MSLQEVRPGLEGVAVAETRLSNIDGDAGELVIAGFPIEELAANATYEESVFLLFEDRLPTKTELSSFQSTLAAKRTLSDPIHNVLKDAASEGVNVMDALRMGIAVATIGNDSTVSKAQAKRLVSIVPTIVAAYWRYRMGQEAVAPREDLGHTANYLYMLSGEEPDPAAVRGLETYLTTVVDHGLNASTFVARAIVSTESDLFSAVTGAVGSLTGPLHGGAPGPVLDMLQQVHETGDPAEFISERLAADERLMGFGHRVYQTRDPRAAVLERATQRFTSDGDNRTFFSTVERFEDVALRELAEHKPERALKTNVEFYTAVLLHAIGIPRELFTATFAVSRVGGWTAHCLEQHDANKIVRPASQYVGATDRTWTPISER